MATAMIDLILSSSTDTLFRGWGKAVSDQIAAFGWVKTADTGQIDWTTITAPTTASQARGYEVWRMADALQAQAPFFIKMEYGSGGYDKNSAGLWITVGTGTNGAGTITGQVSPRAQFGSMYDMGTAVPYRCVFSGDPGRLAFCLGVNRDDGNLYLWAVVERSKDAAGADTTEGVVRLTRGVYGGVNSHFLPYTGPIPPNETSFPCLAPVASTGVVGSDVVLYPVYPFNGDMKNPVRGCMGYFKADINSDTIFNASVYGLSQRFYAVGHWVEGPMLRVTGQGLALRWE
jgi:hypothetical protein